MTSDGVFSGIAKAGTWNASIPVPGGERLRRPWPAQMHGRQQRLRAGSRNFRRPMQRSKTPVFCHKCDGLLFGHLSASR